jgi:hypothetical protein
MTSAEYVRLSPPEKHFGQKNLLGAQLELLKLTQSFHKFRVLRDEELVLKVTLKNYVEEASKEIIKLERLLPRADYKEEKGRGGENEEEKFKKLSLEDEIAKVRAKLGKLQEEI